jgi:hypothetical protein
MLENILMGCESLRSPAFPAQWLNLAKDFCAILRTSAQFSFATICSQIRQARKGSKKSLTYAFSLIFTNTGKKTHDHDFAFSCQVSTCLLWNSWLSMFYF